MANRLAVLPLLQALTTAQNDAEATVERSLGLAGDKVVVLIQQHAALGVAEDRPGDATVLELVGGDLAGESTAGLVEDVLCGDFEALAEVLACEEEVESWWGDDDLCSHCTSVLCFWVV